MTDRIDVKLTDSFDIEYGPNGDLVTTQGFDTRIQMSILEEKRADAEEVPVPEYRRGWIGNLDQEGENGSKVWLTDQTRRVQSTLNNLQEAGEDGLQSILDEKLADAVRVETSFTIDGVLMDVVLIVENRPTETARFELWKFTGVAQ